eukprot:scaffold13181_cov36-Phaeocystis_antarctica.AAC.1
MQRCFEATLEAATVCDGGCNPVRWRLQPRVTEAATLCSGGCNPMWRRLQPHVLQVRRGHAGAAIRAQAGDRGGRYRGRLQHGGLGLANPSLTLT